MFKIKTFALLCISCLLICALCACSAHSEPNIDVPDPETSTEESLTETKTSISEEISNSSTVVKKEFDDIEGAYVADWVINKYSKYNLTHVKVIYNGGFYLTTANDDKTDVLGSLYTISIKGQNEIPDLDMGEDVYTTNALAVYSATYGENYSSEIIKILWDGEYDPNNCPQSAWKAIETLPEMQNIIGPCPTQQLAKGMKVNSSNDILAQHNLNNRSVMCTDIFQDGTIMCLISQDNTPFALPVVALIKNGAAKTINLDAANIKNEYGKCYYADIVRNNHSYMDVQYHFESGDNYITLSNRIYANGSYTGLSVYDDNAATEYSSPDGKYTIIAENGTISLKRSFKSRVLLEGVWDDTFNGSLLYYDMTGVWLDNTRFVYTAHSQSEPGYIGIYNVKTRKNIRNPKLDSIDSSEIFIGQYGDYIYTHSEFWGEPTDVTIYKTNIHTYKREVANIGYFRPTQVSKNEKWILTCEQYYNQNSQPEKTVLKIYDRETESVVWADEFMLPFSDSNNTIFRLCENKIVGFAPSVAYSEDLIFEIPISLN